MPYPLFVAFVWHMHQPYYRVPGQDAALLPWARLHASKDYLHMAEVLQDYPNVHITFNMVPSLTEQLLDYASGRLIDRVMSLAQRVTWTDADKAYLRNICYSINWNNVARRYPRYDELINLHQRGDTLTDADLRDLITWFNLGWTDPNRLESDPSLAALVRKGRDFTLGDIHTVLEIHRRLCRETIETYRRLQALGRIELTTSPYYHPILPLLVDNRHAQRATPGLPLPPSAYAFAAPQDASLQLRRAYEHHERVFGQAPRGLWPSEGAVSPEMIPLVQGTGFQWLASDEEILAHSLNVPISRDHDKLNTNPRVFYQPYRLMLNGEPGPAIIFRDHELSDRIGFLYQNIHGVQAADDMVQRLQWLHWRLGNEQPYLVPIILDGENCWEWYEHNGDLFLRTLYERLNNHPDLRAVTVSEYLEANPPRSVLPDLATGSWIRGDLTTWIGDPEHNRAWRALARTRADLVAWQQTARQVDSRLLARAWEAIYISEGSDWFWWYSRNNSSDQDLLFDQTFRANMAVVYDSIGEPLPEWVVTPIAAGGFVLVGLDQPAAPITPSLRAAPDAGPEWNGAAVLRARAEGGAMQRADAGLNPLQILRVGFNPKALYCRLELSANPAGVNLGLTLRLEAADKPAEQWAVRLMTGNQRASLYHLNAGGAWQIAGQLPTGLGARAVEVMVPANVLGLTTGTRIALQAQLMDAAGKVAFLPDEGLHTITFNNTAR